MPIDTDSERRRLDARGAAEYLGVTEKWVRRQVAARKIPFLKLGRYIRFDTADLDAFMRGNTTWPGRRAS